MIYLRLFWEFFKIGLFAVGGGPATLPFITELGNRTGWYTELDVADMLAVAESTPGPMGINMATYVGFRQGGVLGGVITTIGEVTPSIIIIIAIAAILQKFKESKIVKDAFHTIRPASIGLITAAVIGIWRLACFTGGFDWRSFTLAVLLAVAVYFTNKHPLLYIAAGAVVGAVIFPLLA
jgi:chromate transporter